MTPEDTTPPASTPEPEPDTSHAPPGELHQRLLDYIDLADTCHREGQEADVAIALAPRGWTTQDQADLGASLVRCATLKNAIKAARTGKQTRTEEEQTAHGQLVAAMNPIVVAARGKYPKGSAGRTSYGHGTDFANSSTRTLLDLAAYAFDQLKSDGGTTSPPPKDTLPGLVATEIAALGTLHSLYDNADWAQGEALESAKDLLNQIETEVASVLNVSRRKFQNKMELAYPHTNPANEAIRERCGLPANRRMTD